MYLYKEVTRRDPLRFDIGISFDDRISEVKYVSMFISYHCQVSKVQIRYHMKEVSECASHMGVRLISA